MRSMPELMDGAKSTLMTSAFYGYNHNEIIADGELYDMENMSGDSYPLLAVRRKRGITSMDVQGEPSVPLTGIHGRDQLVFVRGDTVYYNNYPVTGLSLATTAGTTPKKIISFGAYVLIFPDKKYFNTTDLSECGSMDRTFSMAGTGLSLRMCRLDGSNYETDPTASEEPPAEPENGEYWIDESGDTDVLRQWSAATEEWAEVPSTFVKISGTGIGAGLKEYDCIDLSGIALGGLDPDVRLESQVSALNGSVIVYACGSDYIVTAGLISLILFLVIKPAAKGGTAK